MFRQWVGWVFVAGAAWAWAGPALPGEPREPSARIETVAGTGKAGYSGDGGPAARAQLDQPFHCDLDEAGNLYVAEAGNHCVRKIDRKTGVITTVAGTGAKGYGGDGGAAVRAT